MANLKTARVRGLALVLPACSDPVAPSRLGRTAPLAASGLDVLVRAQPNADQTFIAVAYAVEGFGGFFFDEDGTPTVYLKNPASASAVDGQLRAMFWVDRPVWDPTPSPTEAPSATVLENTTSSSCPVSAR